MLRSELETLLTGDTLTLLDSLPPYESKGDIVAIVSRLRHEGHSPEVVAAVLGQAKLRARAAGKFGTFASSMLFTEAGLEQATRLKVAALHAGRFRDAGLGSVADLGCGIGADAMTFAALGLRVTAVEVDEVTAAIAAFNLRPFPEASVLHQSAEDTDLGAVEAVYLDPARRTAGHQNTRRGIDPADYTPSLEFAIEVARRLPGGIKLGPGLDRELIPDDAEAQWVSVDGAVVEMGLWFGAVARQGITRSALVIRGDSSAELAAEGDSPDVEAGPLGDYLHEPDGAVIRARQIGELARRTGTHMVDETIAYLTGHGPVDSPFLRSFRILDSLPLDAGVLKKALRGRQIGTVEIKKRGVDIDPAQFRTRLSPKGPNSATLFLTRVDGHRRALLAERA